MTTTPKTHTAQAALEYRAVQQDILSRLDISINEYCEEILEVGCRYIWARLPPDLARTIITDPESGYWAAFLRAWVQHDSELLIRWHGRPYSIYQYRINKTEMLQKEIFQ